MHITSSAFDDGEDIPIEHTGEGADRSPPLDVGDFPDGTRSLALIVDDPDAPSTTWVHWLIWNLPPDLTRIPAGVPQEEEVAALSGARQGTNDFDELGWGGPLPPPGHGVHHYRFTLYALSEPLDLEAGAHRDELEDALEGLTLDSTRLTGTYERE